MADTPETLQRATARENLVRNYRLLLPRCKRQLLEEPVQQLDKPWRPVTAQTPERPRAKPFSALHLVQERSEAKSVLSSVMKVVAEQDMQNPAKQDSLTPLPFLRPAITPSKKKREMHAVFPSAASSVWGTKHVKELRMSNPLYLDIEMPAEAEELPDSPMLTTSSPLPSHAKSYLAVGSSPATIDVPALPSPSAVPVSILKKKKRRDSTKADGADSDGAEMDEESDDEITINFNKLSRKTASTDVSMVDAEEEAPVDASQTGQSAAQDDDDDDDDEVTFKSADFSRVTSMITESTSPMRRADRTLMTPPRKSRPKAKPKMLEVPSAASPAAAAASTPVSPLHKFVSPTKLTRLSPPKNEVSMVQSPLLRPAHRRVSEISQDPLARLKASPQATPRGSPARNSPAGLLSPRSPIVAADDGVFDDEDFADMSTGRPSLLTLTPTNASPRVASPAKKPSTPATNSPAIRSPAAVAATPPPSAPRRRSPRHHKEATSEPLVPSAGRRSARTPSVTVQDSPMSSPIDMLSPPTATPTRQPAQRRLRSRPQRSSNVVPLKHGMRLRSRRS